MPAKEPSLSQKHWQATDLANLGLESGSVAKDFPAKQGEPLTQQSFPVIPNPTKIKGRGILAATALDYHLLPTLMRL